MERQITFPQALSDLVDSKDLVFPFGQNVDKSLTHLVTCWGHDLANEGVDVVILHRTPEGAFVEWVTKTRADWHEALVAMLMKTSGESL